MSETDINRTILLDISKGPSRLFRNNIGEAWQGKADVMRSTGMTRVEAGDVIVRNARRVTYGVCNPGGSDFIGWHKVTITPEMVGCTVPVFFVVEGKFGHNKATKEQEAFIGAVQRAGGIGVVAYSVADVRVAIELWKPPTAV